MSFYDALSSHMHIRPVLVTKKVMYEVYGNFKTPSGQMVSCIVKNTDRDTMSLISGKQMEEIKRDRLVNVRDCTSDAQSAPICNDASY